MDYTIKTLLTFKVIGFQKEFTNESGYIEIPNFWDEICVKYANNVYKGNPPTNLIEKSIVDNRIGEYGVCIDDV
ncbi:MAG: AraC family transcriptional regulator, partial [Candidatus Riflebacteria bacterium]|nr:AraC family transcriptional regulator [Candidatus Riflebacteria bacterium]